MYKEIEVEKEYCEVNRKFKKDFDKGYMLRIITRKMCLKDYICIMMRKENLISKLLCLKQNNDYKSD